MTNDRMIEGRYLRFHKARQLVARIVYSLSNGRTVIVQASNYKSWRYDHRHVAMFKAARSGVYMRHGKRWDCIDYCRIYQED